MAPPQAICNPAREIGVALDLGDDWTGETAYFGILGAARVGEGFIGLVHKGTLERPGAILAAAKRGKWT